jgi:hypothetical protein
VCGVVIACDGVSLGEEVRECPGGLWPEGGGCECSRFWCGRLDESQDWLALVCRQARVSFESVALVIREEPREKRDVRFAVRGVSGFGFWLVLYLVDELGEEVRFCLLREVGDADLADSSVEEFSPAGEVECGCDVLELFIVMEFLNACQEVSISLMRSSADAPLRVSGKRKLWREPLSLSCPVTVMVPARTCVVRKPEPKRPMASASFVWSSFDDPP